MNTSAPDRPSQELDEWFVIADGTNYLEVKAATMAWLAARGYDASDAEAIDLRMDFLAGPSGAATMRTRALRSSLNNSST